MKKLIWAILPLFAINYGYSQTYIPNNSTVTPSAGYSYNIDGNAVTAGLFAFGTGTNNTMRTTIKGTGSTSSTYPFYITNGNNTSTFYSDDAGNVKILGA